MGNPQFKDIASGALALADVLLPEWMGGERHGHEWHGGRKANGGPGDSWKVNLNTGAWAAFGLSDTKGGDLISLYAALHHIDNVAALYAVAGQVGHTDSPVPRLSQRAPPPEPAEEVSDPIPEDAGDPRPHYIHGAPSAIYRYGDKFIVCRYDLADGSKEFAPHTWREGRWQARGYPGTKKPLYNLEEIKVDPDANVLVVEGEKCVDAARDLRFAVLTTWAGGSGAWTRTDWTPLKGRKVFLWPDNDDPGQLAMSKLAAHLGPIAASVRVIQITDRPVGWDIADGLKEGLTQKEIADYLREARTIGESVPAAVVDEPSIPSSLDDSSDAAPVPATVSKAPAKKHTFIQAGDDDAASSVSWATLGLDSNSGGLPHATLGNASKIILTHPKLIGKVWFDTFQEKIFHNIKGIEREWRESDTSDLTVFIQQALKLPKFNIGTVQEGVAHAARINQRNSLTDWLDSLYWDGEDRLDDWLADCLGVEKTAYSMAVANNWPISMVARAYVPGCQVDTMPVLEGKMGRGKSSFLATLGGKWYDAVPTAFGEKDFLQTIQGRWLIEIPDMTGFGKREHAQILATVTIRNDRYRGSYGRYVEDHPRGCIFAATSETDDYLQDARGRRRFWPLHCTSIDLETLRKQRDNIFAEAVAKYRRGALWYDMPSNETDDEQTARAARDLWAESIIESAEIAWELQERTGIDGRISSSRLLENIGVKIPQQTDSEKKRVARIMREAGWLQSRTTIARYWRKNPRP